MNKKIELISQLIQTFEIEPYEGRVIFFKSVSQHFIDKLTNENIMFSKTYDGLSIEISESNIGLTCFYNLEEFYRMFNLSILSNNFTILNYQKSFLEYDAKTTTLADHTGLVLNNYLIRNLNSEYELKLFLINELADYYSDSNTELVFYTSTKGINKIRITNAIPSLDPNIDYSVMINEFIERAKDKKFKVFIKNQLFTNLNGTRTDGFINLIYHLDEILENAQRDYEIYLREFSFDKLKNEFEQQKEKYFGSQREVLTKILSQLLSIPVAISASLFATYRVQDSFALLVIMLAYDIYAFFIIHIQLILLSDTKLLKLNFLEEVEIIKKKSGLEQKIISKEIEIPIKKFDEIILTLKILNSAIFIVAILFSVFILMTTTINQLFSISLSTLFIVVILLRIFYRGQATIH